KDRIRRVECTDQVLARRDVDGRLSTYRCVGHPEERRRNLRQADASKVCRRDITGDIPDAAAPERDDPAVTANAVARERSPQPGGDRELLAALARGHAQGHGLETDRR